MLQSFWTISQKNPTPQKLFRLAVLGIVGFLIAWLIAQFNCDSISSFLTWESPLLFLVQTPSFEHHYQVFLPTVIFSLFALAIIRLSPQPKTWSRLIIISILLALLVRYLLWRSLTTLNLATPLDAFLSLGIFLLELFFITRSLISLFLMLRVSNQSERAQLYSQAVQSDFYSPSVDILIPSYNEPDFILRRTIIGCQALDYANKSIYLLDDTNRPEIAKLAKELGCQYFTRGDNLYAKAGNLNHALDKTEGELVAVFDADFIPTSNFLTRTVGFFESSQVALVQTPQTFYNPDPISLNLGLEKIIPPEEEIFYRQIQPIKDANGSVVCAGTSFVVRRKALTEIGYFVTDSLSEDYFTGIELSARGYQLIYLNEKLSAGLAAESIANHVEQRLRWARGTLQAFFIKSNPLTIKGLTIRQRLVHLEGILHWFDNFPRILFMVLPLPCLLFNLSPVLTSNNDLIYIFLPFYFFNILVFSWLNLRSRSAVFADIYELICLFPVALTVVKVMLNPFGKGFTVTPKGISREKAYYNWQLAFPLLTILMINILGLVAFLIMPLNSSRLGIFVFWLIYNIVNLIFALLALLDLPQLNQEVSLDREEKILCTVNQDKLLSAKLLKLSENGAEIILNQQLLIGDEITIEILESNLKLKALVSKLEKIDSSFKIKVNFLEISPTQQRKLIETLFCRPGQWKDCQTPGELASLSILVKVLWRFITRGTASTSARG